MIALERRQGHVGGGGGKKRGSRGEGLKWDGAPERKGQFGKRV